jgi:hypothetical protein
MLNKALHLGASCSTARFSAYFNKRVKMERISLCKILHLHKVEAILFLSEIGVGNIKKDTL